MLMVNFLGEYNEEKTHIAADDEFLTAEENSGDQANSSLAPINAVGSRTTVPETPSPPPVTRRSRLSKGATASKSKGKVKILHESG